MIFDDWTVADVCGAASIACWLGAQLPQVIKNWQLQSCEGLALPFLVNWLMGDFTNLIGCILTDQLPFQTYLANYFCFVDIALVAQYFYYKPAEKTPTPSRHVSPHASLVLPAPARSRTSPVIPNTPLPRTNSNRGRRRTQPPQHSHTLSEPVFAADALRAAALDVARAAERVTFRRSGSGGLRTLRQVTEDPMLASFHSEQSLRSTDDELPALTQSTSALDPRHDPRGRSLTRNIEDAEGLDTLEDMQDSGTLEVRRGLSRSHSRARARGSGRRAAGVAFMSLGMILWHVSETKPVGSGHVVMREVASAPASTSASVSTFPWQPLQYPAVLGTTIWVSNPTEDSLPGTPDDEPVDFKQLVGRISAWCCTTLYLTSRLPQIWKNFQRKSVEGLSILLFLFAFLGNTFYVFSIVLAAPPPGEAAHYLLRALPYLLGSGGTLVFDLTIMGQAFLYGSARPTPQITIQRHLRSQSYGPRRRRVHTEEGNAERRPLITSHSPIRAYTEPQRPTSVRAPSTSSITSTGPTTPWITESPKQANARI